jgi:hypothetical protein
MSDTPLTYEQRRIVEEIAAERARLCYFYGSEVWSAPYVAKGSTGPWKFIVTCADCGDGTAVVSVSREEAATRMDLRHGRHQRRINETGGW